MDMLEYKLKLTCKFLTPKELISVLFCYIKTGRGFIIIIYSIHIKINFCFNN